MTEILAAITSLAAALAAALAWAAKLQWSKEYKAAKEEIVRVKDEQIRLLEREIESLRELNPTKIREYFLSMREQFEEWVDHLQEDLKEARSEIAQKDDEINHLQTEGVAHEAEINQLRREKQRIEAASSKLETQITQLRKRYESDDVVHLPIPKLDASFYQAIECSAQELRHSMPHATLATIDPEFSKAIRAYGSIHDLIRGLENKLRMQEGGEAESDTETSDR